MLGAVEQRVAVAPLRVRYCRRGYLSPHSPGEVQDGSGDLWSALNVPEEGGDVSVRGRIGGDAENTATILVGASPI